MDTAPAKLLFAYPNLVTSISIQSVSPSMVEQAIAVIVQSGAQPEKLYLTFNFDVMASPANGPPAPRKTVDLSPLYSLSSSIRELSLTLGSLVFHEIFTFVAQFPLLSTLSLVISAVQNSPANVALPPPPPRLETLYISFWTTGSPGMALFIQWIKDGYPLVAIKHLMIKHKLDTNSTDPTTWENAEGFLLHEAFSQLESLDIHCYRSAPFDFSHVLALRSLKLRVDTSQIVGVDASTEIEESQMLDTTIDQLSTLNTAEGLDFISVEFSLRYPLLPKLAHISRLDSFFSQSTHAGHSRARFGTSAAGYSQKRDKGMRIEAERCAELFPLSTRKKGLDLAVISHAQIGRFG